MVRLIRSRNEREGCEVERKGGECRKRAETSDSAVQRHNEGKQAEKTRAVPSKQHACGEDTTPPWLAERCVMIAAHGCETVAGAIGWVDTNKRMCPPDSLPSSDRPLASSLPLLPPPSSLLSPSLSPSPSLLPSPSPLPLPSPLPSHSPSLSPSPSPSLSLEEDSDSFFFCPAAGCEAYYHPLGQCSNCTIHPATTRLCHQAAIATGSGGGSTTRSNCTGMPAEGTGPERRRERAHRLEERATRRGLPGCGQLGRGARSVGVGVAPCPACVVIHRGPPCRGVARAVVQLGSMFDCRRKGGSQWRRSGAPRGRHLQSLARPVRGGRLRGRLTCVRVSQSFRHRGSANGLAAASLPSPPAPTTQLHTFTHPTLTHALVHPYTQAYPMYTCGRK